MTATLTTLVSFNDADGKNPLASLIADANGDLFGTTGAGGGSLAFGTVFEINKTATGYTSTPTTLVSFNNADGDAPLGSLIADSHGDLFGTTSEGGFGTSSEDNFGTVFEIKKTAAGYVGTPTTLVGFNGADGAQPEASLIADSNGDLFGTTRGGFVGGDNGTVFEIKKTAAGYASVPTTLVIFNGDNGELPGGSLIADAEGDLFGTTEGGGPGGSGTVFEITGSGFVTGPVTPPIVSADILWQNTDGQASVWEMTGNTLVGGGPVSPNPGPSWTEIETGDFNHDGHSDILWQNANGQASIWDMNGNSLIGGGPVTPNPGPAWHAIGAGDFTDDGFSDDILWRNTSSGQVSIWEMSGNTLIGGGPVSPNPGPAWKAIGAGDFNKDERAARLVYYAFDLLHLEGRDVSSLRLTDRKALLEPLVANKSGLQYNGHEIGDGELILKHAGKLGF